MVDKLRSYWGFGKYLLAASVLLAVLYWVLLRPIPVGHGVVGRGEVVAEVMGTGTLEARVKATISPKISGLLTEVLVDQRDPVRSGQILARLDDRDLKHQVEAAEASVEAARAGVDRVTADRKRAGASLDQAKIEYDRLERLRRQEAAEKIEWERATEALRVAEANVGSADAAIVEGRKQVIAADKNLDFYRARLTDTILRAPFDGLIVRRYLDPGNIAVPGAAVLSLISTAELWISAWVDETEMAGLAPGQKARIVFRSEPDRSYRGRVARLGLDVDRETREFLVDVRVEELPKNWGTGMRAEVYIETGRKRDVPALPTSRLIWRDGRPGVFVAARGRAVWRALKIGLTGQEAVELVDGLKPGDIFIFSADPQTPMAEGKRVTVQ
jgi:HlyD family secretion protein